MEADASLEEEEVGSYAHSYEGPFLFEFTSTCGLEKPGIKPLIFQLVDES